MSAVIDRRYSSEWQISDFLWKTRGGCAPKKAAQPTSYAQTESESSEIFLNPLIRGGRGGQNVYRHAIVGSPTRFISDHPVCAFNVASLLFLIAQPPLLWRRGL